MAAALSIALTLNSADVRVLVVQSVGGRFIALRIDDPVVSLIVPDVEAVAADHARAIAAKLLAAADELSPPATSQQPTSEGKDAVV